MIICNMYVVVIVTVSAVSLFPCSQTQQSEISHAGKDVVLRNRVNNAMINDEFQGLSMECTQNRVALDVRFLVFCL